MEIKANLKDRTVFSPYGKKIVPFKDTDASGKEVEIPQGTSLPDLARIYYGVQKIEPFQGRYPFLDRDHKDRNYDPGSDDPFVFNSRKSLTEFNEHAIHLLDFLTKEWQALGLPVKKDEKRGVIVPDGDVIMLSDDPKIQQVVKDKSEEVAFIIANADIALKFCVVRGITPGWWASSYAAKKGCDVGYFKDSMDCIIEAAQIIRKTEAFKRVREKFRSQTGDPLYSNVGYPFFMATIDKQGVPLSRLSVLDLFSGIGTQGWNWDNVVKEINERSAKLGLRGYPFAVAPIRRQQYGRKSTHDFIETTYGLKTNVDFFGYNTVRIAFVVPYIFNLYISPISIDMKSVRALMPGNYNDGEIMRARSKWMRKMQLFYAEGDYSNYDRSMPYDLITAKFDKIYKSEEHFKYWRDMLVHSYSHMPLVWPDYAASTAGKGYVFWPGDLGLLSGMKPTSEIGTDANNNVQVESMLRAGIMNKTQMVKYLTQYCDGSQPGSKFEHYNIQSDDALLIGRSFDELRAYGKSFVETAKKAGLPTVFSPGDRYLMRQMSKGKNTPVPARIWQNTLSNEDPYTDPLKFIVGLASRTDGILGHKTVDAFATGTHRSITGVERRFTVAVLDSVLHFLKSARNPVKEAIGFVSLLSEAGKAGEEMDASRWKLPSNYIAVINEKRNTYVRALNAAETARLSKVNTVETKLGSYKFLAPGAMESMLMQLRNNQYSMTAALTLDELTMESDDLAKANNVASEVEHDFYEKAMKIVKIPTTL